MSWQLVTEAEFAETIRSQLASPIFRDFGVVTGPGRSGAIAAVYASHILRIPFVPFGSLGFEKLGRLLIIDTAEHSGRTLRKAGRKYRDVEPLCHAVYKEPPMVRFWYESDKPQRYKHEAVV